MAASLTTDSALSSVMQTYYDKRFLEWAKPYMVMHQWSQKKVLPLHSGKVVYFSRYTPLAIVTSAGSEGSADSGGTVLSASTISATVAVWHNSGTISDLLSLTSIDPNLEQIIELFAQNMGETTDYRLAKEANNFHEQVAGGHSALSDIDTTTDHFSIAEMEKARKYLLNQKARPFKEKGRGDIKFVCIVDPDTLYDLEQDERFEKAKLYAGAKQLFDGEEGRWKGMAVILGSQAYRQDADGTENRTAGLVHNVLVFGRDAIGSVEIANDQRRKIYVHRPGPQTMNDITEQVAAGVGWKTIWVPKVLNDTWGVAIKCGATVED